MSKRKGVSLEEKRNRILNIYHSTKDVFNLKEIEKIGAKAGVVSQTIKDVNQALIDDNLVDTEKIGSGNYFWSFPSKISQQKKTKLDSLTLRKQQLTDKLNQTMGEIQRQNELRHDSEDRTKKLAELAELQEKVQFLSKRYDLLKENDPAIIEKLEQNLKIFKDGADRWTDNVFTIKSWVVNKRNCPGAEVDKWLGIKDDFDYVE